MSAEVPKLLSIGINSGGISPANRPIHDGLAEVQRRVVRERARFPNEGVRLNVVFDIPGPFFSPDYTGVHVARFDRRKDHILVIAAVPEGLMAADVESYAAGVLSEAVMEAKAHLARAGQHRSLECAERLVHELTVAADA